MLLTIFDLGKEYVYYLEKENELVVFKTTAPIRGAWVLGAKLIGEL